MAESYSLVQASSLSNPDPKFWGFCGTGASKELSKLFSIGLYDLQLYNYINYKEPLNGRGVPHPVTYALYYFTTPPQSYEISEPASVQIVPTQDGGKFVESQGSIFKDIRLSGTVGFRPNPITNELFPGLEAAGGPSLSIPSFLTSKDGRGLNPKESTGFDELIFLRNIFRAYWDIKTDPEWANKVVMVFACNKESELYIVEPINFTTSRDKSSPMSWRYNIQLKTMYKWDVTVPFVKDSLNLFQSISSIASSIRKISRDISSSLHDIAAGITFLANIPGNIVNDILSDGMAILDGLAAVKNAGASFGDVVTKSLLTAFKNNANEARRLFDDEYMGVDGVEQMGVLGGLRLALKSMARNAEALVSIDSLWQGSKQVQIADYKKAYTDKYGETPFSAGSMLAVHNIKIPSSGTEVDIIGTEDIRAVAKRYLGDEAQWKTLVILNNLKPPYISTQVGSGVLGPGSKIIIPKKSATEETSGVNSVINTDQAIQNQSLMMRKYGRDLKIRDSGTQNEGADLIVGQNGDLELIEGVENVEQALMIKFATEQGELALHPDFGAKYPLGTKITLLRIQEFVVTTRKTLLSDPRIESILSMRIAAEGDKILTDTKLKLKGTNQELPISFAVRR